MAVTRTGSMYKGLVFDGVDSRDYGVYITGEAVYNAPARDVEFISIPGRNGAYALDHGRYENIEVRYPAGLFASTEADFTQGISDFRNALCSRRGYCRLEDEYNPNEYRMAVYRAGLEVTPANLQAGEFEIVFDCKPQRFLASGEDTVTLQSGDTITNPTLYDSKPLLEVTGYGDISIDSDTINISDSPLGNILLAPAKAGAASNHFSQRWLNNGDTITLHGGNITVYLTKTTETEVSMLGPWAGAFSPTSNVRILDDVIELRVDFPIYSGFVAGSSMVGRQSIETIEFDNGEHVSLTAKIIKDVNLIRLGLDVNAGSIPVDYWGAANIGEIRGYSTIPGAGSPAYIDLDLGYAWRVDGGVPVSVNNVVTIPAQLPTLSPGSNTITYDNTITDLKITPRWWQL